MMPDGGWIPVTERRDGFSTEQPAEGWEDIGLAQVHTATGAVRIVQLPDVKKRRNRADLPKALAQQTAIEMRNLGISLADGPSQRRWNEIAGEAAMYHIVPDQKMHVRFSPSDVLLEAWHQKATYQHLKDELEQAGAPAVLLAHVVVALVIERGKLTISIDDLRDLIGWRRRETAVVVAQRARVWRMLRLIGSLTVVGLRPGTFRDPRTRKTVDLISRDPLLVVRGTRWEELPAGIYSSSNDVPLEVSIDSGAWLDAHRGNRQILTEFGDIPRIASISAGKASGAWAQSIGLALNQRWRERAAEAQINHVGEDSHPTPVFKRPFTRADLLDLFRTEPHYQEVLEGHDSKRARGYWDEAIRLLKLARIISHYAELKPIDIRRRGWQAAWLAQPLDIRPREQGRKAIEAISVAKRAASARAKRAKKHLG